MARQLASYRTNSSAPTPPVEAILHALLAHRFVDHTHADAVVTLTNTVRGEGLVREVYGDSVVIVPYVMPGFDLARLCARLLPERSGPQTVGMVLMNHGVFSSGDTAGVPRADDRPGLESRVRAGRVRLATDARTSCNPRPRTQGGRGRTSSRD